MYDSSIVADNRRALKAAEEICTADQTMDVRRNVKAFESSLGFLDCTDPFGFVVGRECKISDALACFKSLDMEPNSTVSCELVIPKDDFKTVLEYLSYQNENI